MPYRDDFKVATKWTIARRAGFKCSFPGCGATTEGPSTESTASTSSVGTAAHICAAAENGPRWDQMMTTAQRVHPENGIWMCATHARLIDTDEVRFSVTTLRGWKQEAETRAQAEQGRSLGPRTLDDPLLTQFREFGPDTYVNQVIGQALDEAGADLALGAAATAALRDVLIEVAKNALQHGGAKRVTLSIEPRRVKLVDDGKRFDPLSLTKGTGRGGRIAIATARDKHADLVLSHWGFGVGNQLTAVPLAHLRPGDDLLPCTLTITEDDFRRGGRKPWSPEPFLQCGTIYVQVPDYLSPSDTYEIARRLAAFRDELQKDFVLLLRRVSPTTVLLLQEFLPFARIVVGSK